MALDAVEAAEGTVSVDFLAEIVEGETCVLTAYGVTETVNCPSLVSGRLPESADECVLDQHLAWEVPLGAEIHVSSSNTEDTLDLFTYDSYTVVGFANSPNYLNIERGTTSLGDGTVTGFVYLSPDGFSTDYFTELYIYLGDDTPEIYSEAYEALADSVEPELDDAITSRADERYDELLRDASEEIADGEQELEDGKAELESERADGQRELDDAKKELDDGAPSWIKAGPTMNPANRSLPIRPLPQKSSFATMNNFLPIQKRNWKHRRHPMQRISRRWNRERSLIRRVQPL